MDSHFTFAVECKIFAAMGTCGVCKFGMKKLESSNRSNPNSYSSGPVAGRCHFCKNPEFQRATAMPGFRSAEFGFAATGPKFLPVTTPRYTVKPQPELLQCRCHTSIPATSKARFRCFSDPTQAFQQSFSSMDPISISSVPSIL